MDKECNKCNKTKNIKEFNRRKINSDGYDNICKSCRKIYLQKWYQNGGRNKTRRSSQQWQLDNQDKTALYLKRYREKNKDRIKEQKRKWYQENKERWQQLQREHYRKPTTRYKKYKRDAEQRNYLFNLSFDEFMTFWQQQCVYCDDSIDTVGIDRVDNTNNYTMKNCVACCKRCNQAKNDMPKEIFLKHIEKIYHHAVLEKL